MEQAELIRGYATALFEVAEAEGVLERVSDELFRIGKAVEQNHEFRSALTDIHIPAERKQAMVANLLGDRAADVTRNVVDFVISQGRAGELPDIVDSLTAMASERRGRVVAEIRSAVELDDELRDRVAEAIGRATGRTVEAKVVVDPKVVGGVYVKIGDQVIDGTVRRRLQELKEHLEVGG